MALYYALVDCNNFYVSCERVFDPTLRNRPVVILSNNDGCAVARSNEARDLGIPFGAPWFKIRSRLEEHGAAVRSSNYALYGDLSRRVMDVLALFSPEVEVYSIDEAFLVLRLNPDQVEQYAREMGRTVYRWTGIPVSTGVAPTKTLAKLAATLAKRRPGGTFRLLGTDGDDELLAALPAEKVWGIGNRRSAGLERMGVRSALDLKRMNEKKARRELTVMGLRTVLELRGISCIPFEEAPPPRKALASSRSFGRASSDRQEVAGAVARFASRCAAKLRRENLAAGTVTVFLRTDPFRDTPRHSEAASASLPLATHDSLELVRAARSLARVIFRPGYEYKKAGVLCTDLQDARHLQLNLFRTGPRREGLMEAVDSINRRFGRDAVTFGPGEELTPSRMRREMLSPRYTTCWDDLPVVR
jgi:DNA polymerase V